jgi:predicted nucleotidyltransferase
MLKSEQSLTEILNERLQRAAAQAKRCVAEAAEIIIFGSMSVGLERSNSDLDVLCVCALDYKQKTDLLDLIAIPKAAISSPIWLQGELATHVGEYGRWIEGTASWRTRARVGPTAVAEKRRRIAAFMKSLPLSWSRLEEGFRVKYSIKLRRETQRLILLEQGIPIPPTRILDRSWTDISRSPYEVCDYLRHLSVDSHDGFTQDLVARVDAHLQAPFVA